MAELREGIVGLLEAGGADERVGPLSGRERGRVGAGDHPVLPGVDQGTFFLFRFYILQYEQGLSLIHI